MVGFCFKSKSFQVHEFKKELIFEREPLEKLKKKRIKCF